MNYTVHQQWSLMYDMYDHYSDPGYGENLYFNAVNMEWG